MGTTFSRKWNSLFFIAFFLILCVFCMLVFTTAPQALETGAWITAAASLLLVILGSFFDMKSWDLYISYVACFAVLVLYLIFW